MAIQSAPFYWVVCDWQGCEAKSTDDGEFSAWADAEQAVEDAANGGWDEIDGKNYCNEHIVWDDELETHVPGVAK